MLAKRGPDRRNHPSCDNQHLMEDLHHLCYIERVICALALGKQHVILKGCPTLLSNDEIVVLPRHFAQVSGRDR